MIHRPARHTSEHTVTIQTETFTHEHTCNTHIDTCSMNHMRKDRYEGLLNMAEIISIRGFLCAVLALSAITKPRPGASIVSGAAPRGAQAAPAIRPSRPSALGAQASPKVQHLLVHRRLRSRDGRTPGIGDTARLFCSIVNRDHRCTPKRQC
jgi:hypothetical protein